jgi:homoserine dehydrogenase
LRRRPVLRIALVGFGHVGRRFATRLGGAYGRILREAGVSAIVTGIATARHGMAVDSSGLPLARALAVVAAGRSLEALHRGRGIVSVLDFVGRVPADVLVEISPLDPRQGEPATSHVRAALRRGLHVVTANKGPVAFARRALMALARRRDRLFLHEGAVMDGTPIFNLKERCLPGVRIEGFRGILNATTSRILAGMERGQSAAAALREAQVAGVAESDPRHDIDGWDAAVKGCVLANTLMGADLRPAAVHRRGVGSVTPGAVRRAARRGRRIRLTVRGRRVGGKVRVTVAPEEIPHGDLLVSLGADGVLVLETDLMGEIGIWEGAGGVDQTAYALLSDLVQVARRHAGPRRPSAKMPAR